VLTVAVLGAVEAYRDGVRLDLPAGKTTELLARLALEAGRPVRADALLEDLWVDPAARNTLQSKVSQLRRALGDKDLVMGSGDRYTLAVPGEAVDAFRVRQLAAASAAARSAGDLPGALASALDGLALFRGAVLVDAGDWANPHRNQFEEVRLGLVESAMAARVDLGAGGELVAELGSLVEEHPLREGLWVALITALYRAGRQADALAAYSRVRRLLANELGVDPGSELRSLEQQVLRHSPGLDPRVSPTLPSPGNVAPVAAPIIGREDDLTTVVAAVGSHRLVTVVGPGGVGKTRLVLEVAQQLAPPGGVWLVRLDEVDAGGVLADVVAETLHVGGGERSLRERLSGAETVLMLDNCEHVIEKVDQLVPTLLDAAPRLRVLATSQAPLGLEDEHLYQLEPLSQEESVTLFVRRAREQRRSLRLDPATTTVVEEVCRSLDGLPLAIELAASRVRSLSVRDIARRLEDRFALLRDPSSHRAERRRALEGAIEWSYELLFPDDQRGLWALSCFAGSATLGAVERVLSALGVPTASAVDTIARLVDRSLISLDSTDGGEVRYRMLDSIRAYAAQRLREAGQADLAAAAHAGWYAETAAWCDAHVRSEQQPTCLAVVRAERANTDVALAWSAAHDPQLGVQIANRFGWTWVVLGDGTAGAARVRNALADQASALDRATGLLLAGWLEASAGNVVLAHADLDQARELAEKLADAVLLADVERHQAFLAIQEGSPKRVLSAAAASLATYRPLNLRWRTAGSLLLGAYGALMVGDTGTATRDATEAVGILTDLGDSWGLVHAQALLGGIAQAEHRLADAAAALERAAEKSATMGFLGQAALHRATLARVQQRLGDPRAATSYEQAIREAGASGDGRLGATARLNLARLRRGTNAVVEAIALLEENERWYASAGGGDFALLNQCILAAARDDVGALESTLQEARATENVEVQIHALDALARLAAARDDVGPARSLLAEADALAPQVGHILDEADRLDGNEVRQRLGSIR
jgi:predicted ATPase/DNA-binding SARP family transcriptional activator